MNVPKGFRGPVVDVAKDLKEQSFLMEPLTIGQGEIIQNFDPINMPEGHLAVKGFTVDVVKQQPGKPLLNADGSFNTVQASRDEVYMHHYTVNKWQMRKAEFDKWAAKGSDPASFDEADPRLFLHEAGMNSGSNGPCGTMLLHSFAGAGNEVRGARPGDNYTVVYGTLEEGTPGYSYAWEVDTDSMAKEGIAFMFNAHLIDVRDVASTDLRGCTECDCKVTGAKIGLAHRLPTLDGPFYEGGLACCHSSQDPKHKVIGGSPARCPYEGAEEKATYYIKYTVAWRDWSEPRDKRLETMYFDSSDTGADWNGVNGGTIGGIVRAEKIVPGFETLMLPGAIGEKHAAQQHDEDTMASIRGGKSGILQGFNDCHVEYYVPPCKPSESCRHSFKNSWAMPYDGEVVGAYGHYHTAALSQLTTMNNRTLCPMMPTYAKWRGGEQLVGISDCRVGVRGFQPVTFKKGDIFEADTITQQDEHPYYGMMAFSVLF